MALEKIIGYGAVLASAFTAGYYAPEIGSYLGEAATGREVGRTGWTVMTGSASLFCLYPTIAKRNAKVALVSVAYLAGIGARTYPLIADFIQNL